MLEIIRHLINIFFYAFDEFYAIFNVLNILYEVGLL
jgi:hypothetical protein